MENYILSNPNINIEMTHMVRQLDPTSKGMLEIYCFTYEKNGKKYEVVNLIFWSFTNDYLNLN
jgi:miniconductance mechanosensitive channel